MRECASLHSDHDAGHAEYVERPGEEYRERVHQPVGCKREDRNHCTTKAFLSLRNKLDQTRAFQSRGLICVRYISACGKWNECGGQWKREASSSYLRTVYLWGGLLSFPCRWTRRDHRGISVGGDRRYYSGVCPICDRFQRRCRRCSRLRTRSRAD